MTAKKKLTTRLWRPKKFTGAELKDLIEEVILEEREACAKIADEHRVECGSACGWLLAQAIRARGAEN